jgi:hypothetical protein
MEGANLIGPAVAALDAPEWLCSSSLSSSFSSSSSLQTFLFRQQQRKIGVACPCAVLERMDEGWPKVGAAGKSITIYTFMTQLHLKTFYNF